MPTIHRCALLMTGLLLTFIGLAYCIDPNLLLARYDLSVNGASEDNMYRGAYGGLFVSLGIAIFVGFFSNAFRQTSTVIAVLFMGGFAIGRVASISAFGVPHEQIINLLVIEVFAALFFAWLMLSDSAKETPKQTLK